MLAPSLAAWPPSVVWHMPESDTARPLPVLAAVADYEKIKRIGEGTYGVVCTRPIVLQYIPGLKTLNNTAAIGFRV